jgi:ABC-type antimicrobial peptide transport system permease subunit
VFTARVGFPAMYTDTLAEWGFFDQAVEAFPLYWVQSLDAAIAQSLWFVRVFGTMFLILGFVALFLASIGLSAVMSFSVSRRTCEVGIRMALGAQRRDVVRMIFNRDWSSWEWG